MLIAPAYAQAAGGGTSDIMMSLLPLVLIFVVFYFLLIRPQQKKMKTHREMLKALRRGDRVVTAGGILGTIVKVGQDNDPEVAVEIAEGVRVKVLRGTITDIMTRGEPVKQEAASDTTEDGAMRPRRRKQGSEGESENAPAARE
jgi:preprotein translocase subunit YajC